MKFDDILTVIGEFGPYQHFQYFLVCMTSFSCAFQVFVSIFLLETPKFRCRLPEYAWPNDTYAIQNTQHERIINYYIPLKSKNQSYDQCKFFNSSSFNMSLSNSSLFSSTENQIECNNGWVYDKSEFTETFMSEFNIVCGNVAWKSPMKLGFLIGIFIGALSLGMVSDKIGRKKTLMIGILLHIISAFGSIVVFSGLQMFIMRVIGGIASAGLFPIAFVYGMEIVGPRMRTHTGMIIEYVFGVGFMLLCLVAYLVRYWRYLQLAISIPLLLYISYWWLLSESPRWLILQSRVDEAKEILKNIARVNKKEFPYDIDLIIATEGKDNSQESEPFWKIYRYPKFMICFAVVCFQWFVITMLYYGLSLNTGELPGSIYLNSFFSALVEIPGYVFPHITVQRIGRKIPHILSMISGGLACGCTIFFTMSDKGSSVWVTVLAIIGKGFSTAAFAIIYIWTAEILPTKLRSIGIGIASMCGRLGSFSGPLIFDLKYLVASHLGNGLPLLIFGILGLIAGFTSFILPETLNCRLPQTLKDTQKASAIVHPKPDNIINMEINLDRTAS